METGAGVSDTLLESWQFQAKACRDVYVMPDGCRDLIYVQSGSQKPRWFISQLDDVAGKVDMTKGDIYYGFRLKPGVLVDVPAILSGVDGLEPDRQQVFDTIEQFTHGQQRLSEILTSLGSDKAGVAHTAHEFGVSVRTLQRSVVSLTGKTPVFWQQLARIRRAARQIGQGNELSQVAYDTGFADQAHMTRQFVRWFQQSPVEWRGSIKNEDTVLGSGYF